MTYFHIIICWLVVVGKIQANCELDASEFYLRCKNYWEKPNDSSVRVLEVVDFEKRTVNISKIIDDFPSVKNLRFFDGNVTGLTIGRIKTNKLEVVEIRNTQLQHVNTKVFSLKLDVLDLTGNNIQDLDNFEVINVRKLRLSDNKWNCSLKLDWTIKLNKTVVEDINNVTCFEEPFAGKPVFRIARLLQDLKEECPEICICTMDYVFSNIKTGNLEPIIKVDCSNRGLNKLPEELPKNTRILLLKNNDIEDLSPLKQNPIYQTVEDLYLDDNRVKSIEGLEGSHWLSRFRVLSLCGNKLSQLPTYALDNSLERNPNMPNAVRVYLGSNPWRCDCIYTPSFQVMLQKYRSQIPDVDDVRCSYLEGDENSLLPIYTLSRSSVCRPSTEYSARALDLLNGVLASLIILILGKLAYDYYHFKRTGKLPWIVMKMP